MFLFWHFCPALNADAHVQQMMLSVLKSSKASDLSKLIQKRHAIQQLLDFSLGTRAVPSYL
jgi:hypothetical protein